jgi:hypothetical protein
MGGSAALALFDGRPLSVMATAASVKQMGMKGLLLWPKLATMPGTA